MKSQTILTENMNDNSLGIIEELQQLLAEKDKIILEKETALEQQRSTISDLHYRLHQALKGRFGRKSEKQDSTVEQLELEFVFDEAQPVLVEPLKKADDCINVPAHQRKKSGRKPLPADLPRIEVFHDIDDTEKTCACGSPLCHIGDERSEQLDFIPAKVQVIVNVRKKYACKACEETIKIAPAPAQMIPKSIATPGLLSHIAISKYDDHLPLYRQEEILLRHGVDIARNTLGEWMIRSGEAIEPLIKLLHHEIISYDRAFSDETPLQVLKQPGKTAKQKSYMWVFSGGPPERYSIIYHYGNTRSSQVPLRFFEDFKGYLHTDAYSGYLPLVTTGKVKIVGCLAHIRRQFFAITQTVNTEGLAHIAMKWITALYRIEDRCREEKASIAQIKAYRNEKARPIVQEMGTWLKAQISKVPAKSPIGKALYYAIEQWPNFSRYLEDGRLEIDNNRSERAVKPFVVGRKNWLFAGNHRGAIASANLYSLIETAKAHGLNPYDYLRHVFTHLPNAKTLEQLEALLPFNCKSVVF